MNIHPASIAGTLTGIALAALIFNPLNIEPEEPETGARGYAIIFPTANPANTIGGSFHLVPVTVDTTGYEPCATEDDQGPCLWDDGTGLAFIVTTDGEVVYL